MMTAYAFLSKTTDSAFHHQNTSISLKNFTVDGLEWIKI